MKIVLDGVSKGRQGQALPETSLHYESGDVRFVLAETEQRPAVLGLIASGRMRPDTGRVTIDDNADARGLRRRIALVDAPDVSDPHPGVAVAGMVGEELMFAGKPATPVHARRWLASAGFADIAGVPIGNVDPFARVRILCELAVLRDGVEGIVLVHPDRHGGSPDGWSRIAREFAERGYAMLVIIGGSAAAAIERMPAAGAHPRDDGFDAALVPDRLPDAPRPATEVPSDADADERRPSSEAPDPTDAAGIRDSRGAPASGSRAASTPAGGADADGHVDADTSPGASDPDLANTPASDSGRHAPRTTATPDPADPPRTVPDEEADR